MEAGLGRYAGDTDGMVMMTFENGVRGIYEGCFDDRRRSERLDNEYVRVDCEQGTAILNTREIEIFTRNDLKRQRSREGHGQKIQLIVQPKWLNTWLIEKFCQWLDGGRADGDERRGQRSGKRADLRLNRKPAHRHTDRRAGLH